MALTPDSTDLSVSSLFSFNDYVCLVTGGATGLGKHILLSSQPSYIVLLLTLPRRDGRPSLHPERRSRHHRIPQGIRAKEDI